jgi:hypothetical protein
MKENKSNFVIEDYRGTDNNSIGCEEHERKTRGRREGSRERENVGVPSRIPVIFHGPNEKCRKRLNLRFPTACGT